MIKKLIFLLLIPVNVFSMQDGHELGNRVLLGCISSITRSDHVIKATTNKGLVLKVWHWPDGGFSGSIISGEGRNLRHRPVRNPEKVYNDLQILHEEQKGRN